MSLVSRKWVDANVLRFDSNENTWNSSCSYNVIQYDYVPEKIERIADKWKCDYCGRPNSFDNDTCLSCGAPEPDYAIRPGFPVWLAKYQ